MKNVLMICRPVEDHSAGWSNLWDSGDSDLWDRGKASPALVDIIEKERDLFNPFTSDGRRKKAFVPASHLFLVSIRYRSRWIIR